MKTKDFNDRIDDPAKVMELDEFLASGGGGGMAKRLIANNMNVECLRTNDTLTYDAWKHIDTAVLPAAQQRLAGVADLIAAGLTFPTNGLAQTILQYQDASDVSDAEINMDGVNVGGRDRKEYDTNYLPLPIISKDFSFSAREIAASNVSGEKLDTAMAERAARKVAEMAEQVLFLGASAYTMGGGTIRGYEDHPDRNTGTVTSAWATGANAMTDVRAMKAASILDRYFKPYHLYVGTTLESTLDDNYVSGYPTTIRDRLLQVDGVDKIQVIDKMTVGSALLVSMQSDVVRIVQGLPITTIQWDSSGGLMVHFKVMAILVPQIRSDQENRSGVQHWSV